MSWLVSKKYPRLIVIPGPPLFFLTVPLLDPFPCRVEFIKYIQWIPLKLRVHRPSQPTGTTIRGGCSQARAFWYIHGVQIHFPILDLDRVLARAAVTSQRDRHRPSQPLHKHQLPRLSQASWSMAGLLLSMFHATRRVKVRPSLRRFLTDPIKLWIV